MHAKSRSGVDLADATAGIAVALGNILGKKVDAADVQANGLNRAFCHITVVWVDDVGHINGRAAGGEVGGRAQVYDFCCCRNRVSLVALFVEQLLRLIVELEPRQCLLVTHSTPWISIDRLDQLFDRALSITHHVTGHSFGGGD